MLKRHRSQLETGPIVQIWDNFIIKKKNCSGYKKKKMDKLKLKSP